MAQRKAAAVSMEPELFEAAKARARALHLSTFSAYVVQLINQDLRERGELRLSEEGHGYGAPKTTPFPKQAEEEQTDQVETPRKKRPRVA